MFGCLYASGETRSVHVEQDRNIKRVHSVCASVARLKNQSRLRTTIGLTVSEKTVSTLFHNSVFLML